MFRIGFATLVIAIVALGAPVDATASPGGVRIIVQRWTPTAPSIQKNDVVLDQPNLISDALNSGWALARDKVCAQLKARAGAPNAVAPGFSLYDIDCRMAKSGTLTVIGLSGNSLMLDYRLAGNMFKATSTQPTAAGSYADPCAFVSYDLAADTTVHLDTLAVDAFTAKIDRVSRPDSCNAAGDIAAFFAKTLHFFGGPDFLAMAQAALTITQDVSTSKLNAAVASFVDPLRTYSKQYVTQQSWVLDGDLYFAFAPAYVPQPLSASLGGSIDIVKTGAFVSAPDCGIFAIIGNVQTGPQPIVNPKSLATGPAPSVDVGRTSSSGVATDAGEHFVCTYRETLVPQGVPVTYRGSGTIDQIGHVSHVRHPVNVKPEGWTGTEAIASSLTGRNFIATTTFDVGGFERAVKPGTRLDRGDPARANVAGRIDPAVNERSVIVSASSTNRLSRVGLNPQPLPPKVADADVLDGNARFARSDFAGASASYQRSVDRNASDAIALHNLALAHARLGLTDRARGEFERAGKMARKSGDIATADAADRGIIIVSGKTLAPR